MGDAYWAKPSGASRIVKAYMGEVLMGDPNGEAPTGGSVAGSAYLVSLYKSPNAGKHKGCQSSMTAQACNYWDGSCSMRINSLLQGLPINCTFGHRHCIVERLSQRMQGRAGFGCV